LAMWRRGWSEKAQVACDEALHDGGHFSGVFCRGQTSPIGRDWAGGGPEDLLIEPGVLSRGRERRPGEFVVDGVEAEVVDDEIGGGVVAHGDHERERVLRVRLGVSKKRNPEPGT